MPEKAVPLDYSFSPRMSLSHVRKMWEEPNKILFSGNRPRDYAKIVPMLHAWSKSSLISNLRWFLFEADADTIMLGISIHPYSLK